MFRWYRELAGVERRTFWSCYAGWALDAFNVQLYSFLISALTIAWQISRSQAGMLATATLIASALGGWIGGIMADRYGRVPVMQITIAWFAIFTFLCGWTTSFEQLLVCRILQGIGFGAEWGAGAVLMGEIVRSAYRGKAVGCLASGYAVGWAGAALISTLALTWLPQDYAWRAVFWIGILPAGLIIFLRRYVPEPEIFEETRKATAAAGRRPGVLSIFQPGVLRTTVLASLLASGVQGSGYTIGIWLPTYLRTTRNLPISNTGFYMFVFTVGCFFGYIGSAYLADAVGRRRNLVLYSLGALSVVALYLLVPLSDAWIMIFGFPLGFFTQGIFAVLGPYFSELFPTELRASGQSFSYNFGRCAGALVVTSVGLLAQDMPLNTAIGVAALSGYVLVMLAVMMLPETKGIELRDAGASRASSPQSAASVDRLVKSAGNARGFV